MCGQVGTLSSAEPLSVGPVSLGRESVHPGPGQRRMARSAQGLPRSSLAREDAVLFTGRQHGHGSYSARDGERARQEGPHVRRAHRQLHEPGLFPRDSDPQHRVFESGWPSF